MADPIVSACSVSADDARAAAELAHDLAGVDASAVVVFLGHRRDGALVVRTLREHFPLAEIIGCTTAGEFSDRSYGIDGAVALALPRARFPRAAAALARFDGGVVAGVRAAAHRLSAKLGRDLRECDPARHVGVVLLEGLRKKEEEANDALGQVAPFLSFVGGSAGDDLAFRETRVYAEDAVSKDGAALLVLETAAPFVVMKACSFRPRDPAFRVTRASAAGRVVYELDGRPIVEVYAGALDVSSSSLDRSFFARHPLGVMIDGQPWIRSPIEVRSDGGVEFFCQLVEGTHVHVMDRGDLMEDTRRTFADGARSLGVPVAGAMLFNCVLRRYELEERRIVRSFSELLRFPTAGFHTYGESWLGHMNHTLTGLLFG